jgi:serine phosphatase RsbU (regulator of sigma subunit)
MSLGAGGRGEAWPFALLLAGMTAYEAGWLRFVNRAIEGRRTVSIAMWRANIIVESLLPTLVLLLQVYTPSVGPSRTLASPAVLGYFLFIVLSTLRLNPGLSRLAGICSAAGYSVISGFAILISPHLIGGDSLWVFGSCFSTAAILLVGGFAAGAVARQIRLHVVAALQDAENRAKIAQLEHDLGIARSIQQGLIPDVPPQADGFDIAGWNQPADETGGDYYDWQQLGDGRIAVTIADVTGHGIGPALCMAACRAYSRAGLLNETDLQAFLHRLNHLLYQDLPPEKFVTLATGVLEPREASLALISAGHGPLLFYSLAEDRFRYFDAQGVPLGLLPQFPYCGPQALRFQQGDILLLITDGFVEWANPADEDFGQARVENVIRACREKPASAIIAELYSAVRKFAESTPQLDDLTALVVKRV